METLDLILPDTRRRDMLLHATFGFLAGVAFCWVCAMAVCLAIVARSPVTRTDRSPEVTADIGPGVLGLHGSPFLN
jgi:hypothetical protein